MKYDAFISYRHSELDMEMAKKLHTGLETFRVPGAVAKKSGKKNIKRVFRDQEELPIGSDLDDNIAGALRQSEYLIVICSPRTPESYWVCKEIESFIEMHDRSHVLAMLIEGEPNESFPPALLADEEGNPVEPLAADVRGETRKERNKKFKTELVRLAAPLLHCSYDDLRQRHRERKIKRLAAIISTASVLMAALGISFAIYNAKMAGEIKKNYDLAQHNYEVAEQNYNVALTNLSSSLENQSKNNATTSLRLLKEGYRADAALVALAALSDKEGLPVSTPYVPKAELALSKALCTYSVHVDVEKDAMLEHDRAVSDFVFDNSGKYIASYDQNDSVYIWDAESNSLLAKIPPLRLEDGYNAIVKKVAFLTDSVVVCYEKFVRCYDLAGEEIWNWTPEEYLLRTASTDPDTGKVFVGGLDGVYLLDGKTGSLVNKYMLDDKENNFSPEACYDTDSRMWMVGVDTDDDMPGICYIFDDELEIVSTLSTTGNSITEVELQGDRYAFVADTENYSFLHSAGGTYTYWLEAYDVKSGAKIWTKEFTSRAFDAESSSILVRSRAYTDATGEVHEEVFVSDSKTLGAYDAATGEEINCFSFSSAIENYLLSLASPVVYVAESSGNINRANVATGVMNASDKIETVNGLRNCKIVNGIVAVRVAYSPDLMLLKYHDGSGMVDLLEDTGRLSAVIAADDESSFVTYVSDSSSNYSYSFFTADGSYVGSLSEEEMDGEGAHESFAGYINGNEFLYVTNNGVAYFIDPLTTKYESQQLELDQFEHLSYYSISANGEWIVFFNGDDIHLLDAKNREWKSFKQTDTRALHAVVTEDGSKIYYMDKTQGIFCINTADGSVTKWENEKLTCSGATGNKLLLALTRDGSRLAVCCSDDLLRICNTADGKVTDEVPFVSMDRDFIRFTEDGKYLVMQGDDYYVRIYDVTQSKIVYFCDDQYNMFGRMVEDTKNGRIALISGACELVLSMDKFDIIADINYGSEYLPNSCRVLVRAKNTVKAFPFQTLDSLKADAKAQFGDYTLSERKQLKYNLE